MRVTPVGVCPLGRVWRGKPVPSDAGFGVSITIHPSAKALRLLLARRNVSVGERQHECDDIVDFRRGEL